VTRNRKSIPDPAFAPDLQHLPVSARERNEMTDRVPAETGKGLVASPSDRILACKFKADIDPRPFLGIVVHQQAGRNGPLGAELKTQGKVVKSEALRYLAQCCFQVQGIGNPGNFGCEFLRKLNIHSYDRPIGAAPSNTPLRDRLLEAMSGGFNPPLRHNLGDPEGLLLPERERLQPRPGSEKYSVFNAFEKPVTAT
jgi:hypothetical protein